MAKGSGTTRTVGSNAVATPRSNGGSPNGGSLPSERDFYRITGMRFGRGVEDYQVSLALLNEQSDDSKIFTGATVKEAKAMLKKYIEHMGGSTKVGKWQDYFKEVK